MIYHICSKSEWAAAEETDIYTPESLEKEGFIHFSTNLQIIPTANRFYRGKQDLILIEINEKESPQIRFEPATDRPNELFPHFYGKLATDMVVRKYDFPSAADGTFSLPGELSAVWREAVIQQVIAAAIQSVSPENVIAESFQLNGEQLSIQNRSFDLSRFEKIQLIAIGKAAQRLAAAVEALLGERITDGLVILKHPDDQVPLAPKYQVIRAGHPLPDENSQLAAREALKRCKVAGERDLILFLISGGGSALMTLPEAEIPFEDFVLTNKALLASGASIQEFNCLRKHLDQVKGGKLAECAKPAQTITCILSDVVGNDLNAIASGPTVPDATTFYDCEEILIKYDLKKKLPESVLSYFRKGLAGKAQETLKAENFDREKNHSFLIGDNLKSARAAAKRAVELGFYSEVITTSLTGEAKDVGLQLAEALKQPVAFLPALKIAGGETTVTLSGDGLGGRNLEVALAAVAPLNALQNVALVTLATDGEDGPTDAAGAIVTGETCAAGEELGLKPASFLSRHDSYRYFEAAGGLIKIGPTGTNVNDLNFLFYF